MGNCQIRFELVHINSFAYKLWTAPSILDMRQPNFEAV